MAASDSELIHFTNCRLAIGSELRQQDLWVNASTGKIVDAQAAFYNRGATSLQKIDLEGRILAAGFIECQLNGGYGFDFSVPSDKYVEEFQSVNRKLVQTGVTSYLPTLTSQRPEVYKKVLPLLAPRSKREPGAGAEPLGTHCEGPFLSNKKPGIHAPAVLQQHASINALEDCYDKENLKPSVIRKITLAPELDSSGKGEVVSWLVSKGIIASIGHTAASNEEAQHAVLAGASMVTHMFNAMPQPHHRDIGVFGLLGEVHSKNSDRATHFQTDAQRRPYFGLITDGVHVAPNMCAIAYKAHPEGCIVVTDSLHVLGLEDGIYAWPNGGQIRKSGSRCTSLDGKTLAGASATLDQCVSNLIKWTGVSIAEGLKTVTEHPAKLLGLEGVKGDLRIGADADLVILSEMGEGDLWRLNVDEVWKFGVNVFSSQRVENDRPRL